MVPSKAMVIMTNLFLLLIGVDPNSQPDMAFEEHTVSACLRYNAGWTLLHLGACVLMHVLLSIGLKFDLFTTTGPVRPVSAGLIINFIVVDFITNIILSVFYAWVTRPSAVPWSFENPNILELIVTIFAYQVLQDLWHYPTHRFLHATQSTWLREMHSHHHKEAKATIAMNCFDLMNLHPLEYWLTISPAYVAGLWLSYTVPLFLGFSPNFLASHFAALITFTIECLGHSNVDLPVPYILRSLGYSSCSDHAVHHMNPHHNYSIFFTFLDRMFGTYREHSI